MSLFHVLHLSSRSLQSTQAGLQTTANNVANASTEGYHRQTTDFHTVGSHWTKGVLLGQGVNAENVLSAYDRFTEERLLDEHSNLGYSQQMGNAYEALETLVGGVGDGSLSDRLTSLFDNFDALAVSPWDDTIRQVTLNDASNLASEFRSQAEDIRGMAQTADESIVAGIQSVNGYLANIASLNETIVAREAAGSNANDLRDERGYLVDLVTAQLDVQLDEQDDGSLTVMLGGHAAVQGGESRTLTTDVDPNTGWHRVILDRDGFATNITSQIRSGEVAAHLQIRDEVAPELQDDLDQLAYDLMTGINAVHAAGYGLDGVTGRDLFTQPVAVNGAAVAMTVDAAVDGDPNALAAAVDPLGLPGDGSNATALGDLAEALLTAGGTRTLTEGLSGFTGNLAADVATADAAHSLQTEVTAAIEGMRAQRSGVSMEEEAANLIRFQDSYDAMANVMQITQQMLDTLMEIV